MNPVLREFQESLLSVDRVNAKRILSGLLKSASSVVDIEHMIVDVLEKIGLGWEQGEFSLAQVYMSGRICEELVEILPKPEMVGWTQTTRMAIALLNDYHALGKRMVVANLKAAGFHLQDYGRVVPEELVEKILRDDIQIILLSVLMFPSALQVGDVRKMLDAKGSRVKIVVGGAPFRLDKQLWKQVGADAVGYSASDAIAIVQSFNEGEK